jgi:hypothetical protein
MTNSQFDVQHHHNLCSVHCYANNNTSQCCDKHTSLISASVVPAACLLAVTFVVHNHTAVLAAVFIAVTAMGGMFSGVYSNNMDIAPQYAGIY